MKNLADLKVAIVCDWLTGIGGAERVVLELHHMFPDAPIYTSQYDPKAIDWFASADVRTAWLQKLPKAFKKFLPILRAQAFSRLDLSAYDLVISSSGAEAKAVKVREPSLHISYIHAPTHYYWDRYNEYLKHPGFPFGFNWLAKFALKILVAPSRRWDFEAAQAPDFLIANSTYTKSKILEHYKRESTVIHPPVDTSRFASPFPDSNKIKRAGFVIAGRQTPYKRIDLAVAACTKLELNLTVIGDGPEHEKLVKNAGPTINFITGADDKTVADYFMRAQAFIFPGVDDFGITPVEAMAAGTPIIAFKAGGALDYVQEGKTGLFFTEQTVDSLVLCLKSFNPANYSADDIKTASREFSKDVFVKNMRKEVERILQ